MLDLAEPMILLSNHENPRTRLTGLLDSRRPDSSNERTRISFSDPKFKPRPTGLREPSNSRSQQTSLSAPSTSSRSQPAEPRETTDDDKNKSSIAKGIFSSINSFYSAPSVKKTYLGGKSKDRADYASSRGRTSFYRNLLSRYSNRE